MDSKARGTRAAGLGGRFWVLWSAFSASNLGDGFTLVGFPLYAVALTDDARLVALVAAARFLPFLVVGLPAGVIIDRFDRRVLAMIAQVGRAAAVAAVAAAAVAGTASIAMLAVVGFAVGVGEVMTDGGLPAVVRDVVAEANLEVANSRLRASETVTNNFIGPPLGALAFTLDPAVPFAAAAALYALSVGFLMRLPGDFTPTPDPDAASGFGAQVKAGLVYVWQHSVLRPLAFAVAAFSFIGSATEAVNVILVTEHFGWSSTHFGLLLAVDAVASFITSFFVMAIVTRTSHGTSMMLSVGTFAFHALVLGVSTVAPLIIFATLLAGVSDPTWNVISATVRQRLVDDHIFGRMMTAYLFIAWSLQPVGAIVGGLIAQTYGSQWVYVLGAFVVGSLLILGRPLFARIDTAMA